MGEYLEPSIAGSVVLKSVSLVVANRPDVVVEIPRPDDLNKLPDQPFTIKEGGEYRIKFAFQVRQDTVQHLKYSQSVKRQGYEVEHSQDEMGTYKPNTDSNPLYEKISPLLKAPSGFLYRGHYDVFSKFFEGNDRDLLDFRWAFDLSKNW